MAVNKHIINIELNALHTKRQNLFQELDAAIYLHMEPKHWGLRKSRNATSLVASNIGISQSTFRVKVLNLFSRSRRKTNKRKSKHSAMLRNKETRHRMFIGLLNATRKLA